VHLRLAACLLALFSIPPLAAHAETRTVTDAAGRSVTVSDTSRIVAIGGAITEILYALGLEDRIVAVDLTSDFPSRTKEKESVGYMRTLSPEGVLSVNPTLVLAMQGSGPKEAIDVLEKASVPFVLVPEAHDGDGVLAKIRFVADAVGAHDAGEALAQDVAADLAALAEDRARIAQRRKAVFMLSMGGGAPLIAGDHTAADDIFKLAGVDNALSGYSGYKPANEESAMAASPDAVVIMAERSDQMTPDAVFANAAFAGTPAARDRKLVALYGSYLLGFGPRTAHAARDLAAAMYPELDLPPLPERPWTIYGP
jgi:iron complex transport system substrate-binding protein